LVFLLSNGIIDGVVEGIVDGANADAIVMGFLEQVAEMPDPEDVARDRVVIIVGF
jgi:hypothetical protein